MPAGRPNAIDESPQKLDIIRDMLKGRTAARISRDFAVSIDAVQRYKKVQLRRYIAGGDPVIEAERKHVQADRDKAVAVTRDLVMEDVSKLRSTGWNVIDKMLASADKQAEMDCDPKAVSGLMREVRENARLQAQLEGRLADKSTTQVNVVILGAYPATAGTLPPEPQTAPAPADDTIDAEWSEITPGA